MAHRVKNFYDDDEEEKSKKKNDPKKNGSMDQGNSNVEDENASEMKMIQLNS